MHQTTKRTRDAIIGKNLVLLDVASVLQSRKGRGEVPSHLVTSGVIQNSATSESHTLKAVIDSGSPFNMISQMKGKEMQLLGGCQPHHKPRGIDGNSFHTYFEQKLEIFTTDSAGQIVCSTGTCLGADIAGFDIILGRPWLKGTRLSINWENDYWTHCRKNDQTATQKIGLLNGQEFEAECSSSDAVAYMIASTETDLANPKEPPRQIPLIPSEYADLAHVFSKDVANTLPENGNHDLRLETTGTPSFGPLYKLSQNELEVLREYIADNLAKRFIQPFTPSAEAPVLFIKKGDGNLRLCVDYRGLNLITKKNRYPLLLISEALDRVVGAKLFTKLDIRAAYNRIRVREEDEWKTAYRSRYGHYEYRVMPFEVVNSLATFQGYINSFLRDYLDLI